MGEGAANLTAEGWKRLPTADNYTQTDIWAGSTRFTAEGLEHLQLDVEIIPHVSYLSRNADACIPVLALRFPDLLDPSSECQARVLAWAENGGRGRSGLPHRFVDLITGEIGLFEDRGNEAEASQEAVEEEDLQMAAAEKAWLEEVKCLDTFQQHSRFKGVEGNGSTWVARCSLLSSTDTEELGKYTDPEKAAEAVDVMTLHLGGSAPNFPNKVAQYESEYPDLYSITLYELIMLLKRNGRLLERPNKTSGYKNVFWEPRQGKWVGVVDIDGTRYQCGANNNELTVALAVDRMRIVVRKGKMTPQDDLNFPLEGHEVDAYLAHDEEETKQILSRQAAQSHLDSLMALGKHKGVRPSGDGTWRMSSFIPGRPREAITSGSYHSYRDAALAWDKAQLMLRGDQAVLHYPDALTDQEKETIKAMDLETLKEHIRVKVKKPGKRSIKAETEYTGVKKVGEKFHARIMVNKKRLVLGTFDSNKTAGLAYDLAVIHFLGSSGRALKFPEAIAEHEKLLEQVPPDIGQDDFKLLLQGKHFEMLQEGHDPKPAPSSRYRGVRTKKNIAGFEASITIDGQQLGLGTHQEEEKAAAVVDLAVILRGAGKLNFESRREAYGGFLKDNNIQSIEDIRNKKATKLDLSAIIWDALYDRAAEMAEAALAAETAANAGPETGLSQPRPPAKAKKAPSKPHKTRRSATKRFKGVYPASRIAGKPSTFSSQISFESKNYDLRTRKTEEESASLYELGVTLVGNRELNFEGLRATYSNFLLAHGIRDLSTLKAQANQLDVSDLVKVILQAEAAANAADEVEVLNVRGPEQAEQPQALQQDEPIPLTDSEDEADRSTLARRKFKPAAPALTPSSRAAQPPGVQQPAVSLLADADMPSIQEEQPGTISSDEPAREADEVEILEVREPAQQPQAPQQDEPIPLTDSNDEADRSTLARQPVAPAPTPSSRVHQPPGVQQPAVSQDTPEQESLVADSDMSSIQEEQPGTVSPDEAAEPSLQPGSSRQRRSWIQQAKDWSEDADMDDPEPTAAAKMPEEPASPPDDPEPPSQRKQLREAASRRVAAQLHQESSDEDQDEDQDEVQDDDDDIYSKPSSIEPSSTDDDNQPRKRRRV